MAAKDKTENTGMVPAADGETGLVGYATGADDFVDVIKENLGVEGVRVLDLPRIKVPAGGGSTWEVPTIDGPDPRRSLEGVVVYWNTRRAYWKSRQNSGSPPDCSSANAEVGVGDNGTTGHSADDGFIGYTANGGEIATHDCATCPLNQYETATRDDGTPGRGKACKEIRQLFMLQEGELLPYVVPLPPTSIRPAQQFFQRLASAALPYYAIEMKIDLKRIEGGPQPYSAASFSSARRLAPDELASVRGYRDQLIPLLQSVDATGDGADSAAEGS